MPVVDGVLTQVSDADLKDGVFHFPDGVKVIGREAFCNCRGLQNIILPEGIKTIGMQAFSGCTGLQSIILPKGVKTTGVSAFARCTSLQSITLPEGLETIGEFAFYYCTGLQSIILPEGVKTIGEQAFYGCTGLQSITLPVGVEMIGMQAFVGCTGLQSIILPKGVKTIREFAFACCTGLQSIALPEGIKTIDADAFESCTNLGSLYIFATNEDEHRRITNLLPEELRSRVIAYEFTQRLLDMVDKELERVQETSTTNPMRRCAKSIAFFPEDVFKEINRNTCLNDQPFYQKALREIGKLALPKDEAGLVGYAQEVNRLVDNVIARANTVLRQAPSFG